MEKFLDLFSEKIENFIILGEKSNEENIQAKINAAGTKLFRCFF
jgi:hypothetical protein